MIAAFAPLAALAVGEIIVDLFAGGGGASTGIEQALGQSVYVAVNHSPAAIEMHRRNHPSARHYCESVFDVVPLEATRGRPVGLLWASPDCTDFSRAKGAKPKAKNTRGLAWVVVKWAEAVAPRVICLENVPEFRDWEDFGAFTAQLQALGYAVEWRVLDADDYGAPTIRKRLYMAARRDEQPIVWPEPTHGEGRALPARQAHECMDWSIPCPSIFLSATEARALRVKRPLADATCRRIASGIHRFVLSGNPFLAPIAASSRLRMPEVSDCPTDLVGRWNRRGEKVASFLSKYFTSRDGREDHCIPLTGPLATVTGIDHHALVACHLTKFQQNSIGQGLDAPLHTVMPGAQRFGLVAAFLSKYYGQGGTSQSMTDPLHTVTGCARFALVTVPIDGETYAITDIGMRMLTPRELARGQGFAEDYVLTGNQAEQVERIGNSVCPAVAAALVRSQFARPRRQVAA